MPIENPEIEISNNDSDVQANSYPVLMRGGGVRTSPPFLPPPPRCDVFKSCYFKKIDCYVSYKMMSILWDTYANDAAEGQTSF